MEVAGLTLSAVAIATLFSTCIECFETFSQGKNLQKDLSYLLIRLDFEKTQLLLWGNSSGILKVENEERHPRLKDPMVCKLIEEALKAIQGLLSDASLLRQRYGVESSTATPENKQSASANLLSRNSMDSFRKSWSRFCIRAARKLPERGASSSIAKARWTIHDKPKFTELLETLSRLVEKLHQVLPVSDSQYDDLETDLAAILDVSQLRLVETALQSSSNPKAKALSKAASVIISNSEIGTIDRRTVVDWLQDTQWVHNPDRTGTSSTSAQGGRRLNLNGRLNYLAENTYKSLYFVNTPDCWNRATSTPCSAIAAAEIPPYTYKNKFHINNSESLRLLFPRLVGLRSCRDLEHAEILGRLHQSLDDVEENRHDYTNRKLPFGIIYIHTSPCQWALQTAVDIADALHFEQLKAVVRLNDRISSSCFQSTPDRIVALQSILARLDALVAGGGGDTWKYLDRIWLDQRLYSLKSDFTAADESSPISRALDIFSKENFLEPFAGLIIVGEVDFCTPLLQAEPFPQTPIPPRACEVYEITRSSSEYKRKYISRLVPRRPPTETKATLSQQQTSGTPKLDDEKSELQNGKRKASPLASGSGKRALTSSVMSDRMSLASGSSST